MSNVHQKMTHQKMYACFRSCAGAASPEGRHDRTPKIKLQMMTIARAAQEPGPEQSLAAGCARKYTRQNLAGEGTSYFLVWSTTGISRPKPLAMRQVPSIDHGLTEIYTTTERGGCKTDTFSVTAAKQTALHLPEGCWATH